MAQTCVPERGNFDIKIDFFFLGFLAFAMIETNLNLMNGSTNKHGKTPLCHCENIACSIFIKKAAL